MVLLEGDKRSSEHAMPLAYSGTREDPFFIPMNILVLGLMNTADRSLAMVDFALRRRFAFFNLKPQYNSVKFRSHLEDTGISKQLSDRIISMMTKLNNFIAERQDLGSGFEIGHSFFCPGEHTILDEDEWFKDIVELEISPLLDEYCIGRQQTRNELEEVLRQYC
jgi:5-methylcytosine-specific restriction protein B